MSISPSLIEELREWAEKPIGVPGSMQASFEAGHTTLARKVMLALGFRFIPEPEPEDLEVEKTQAQQQSHP